MTDVFTVTASREYNKIS